MSPRVAMVVQTVAALAAATLLLIGGIYLGRPVEILLAAILYLLLIAR